MNLRLSVIGLILVAGLQPVQQAMSQTNTGFEPRPTTSVSSAESAAIAPGNLPQVNGIPAVLRAQDSARQEVAAPAERAEDTQPPSQRNMRKVPPPSQFQRFVQESTGRLLPVYGSELFMARRPDTVNAVLPVPPQYLLGPGDEVRVQIWGVFDYAGSHTLDRNGQITLPKVGTFTLAGVAMRDLDGVLRAQLGKVFTNFSVNASLGRLHGIQVYVVGQAYAPGVYQLSSLSTLVTAMFASGGPGPNGSMRAIQLTRAGNTLATLDLYDFIAKGDKNQDVALQDGDVIVIPPVGPRVALTGAIDQAAIYELKPGRNRVGDMLALSGGVPMLAKAQKALLERIDAVRDAPRRVEEIKLDASGLETSMRDGDVLTMLPLSQAFANAVTLQGAVSEPLRYRWFEGMRVSDLIPDREALISPDYYKRKNQLVQRDREQAHDAVHERKNGQYPAELLAATATPGYAVTGGNNNLGASGGNGPKGNGDAYISGYSANSMYNAGESSQRMDNSRPGWSDSQSELAQRMSGKAEQVNWEYAVIERLDKANLSTKLLPFNLGKAVVGHDVIHNLLLQPGDVVTVMSQKDLRLPQDRQTRLVRVEGEVGAPGVYEVQAGETLPQLLRRIGGLTAQAYVFGTEFNRESVRKRQQDNLETLIRRLEAQSQGQASMVASNTKADTAAQAQAILQQQQAQLKGQIERLRAMRSNGRMALELDPSVQSLSALPSVQLEDGDHILVPSVPSFVSAFGSVNNENVFLYKTGKTVGDVIRSAGLTEDAEPDQAFVLRADGSIVAKRDRGGLFGASFESLAMMPGDTVVVPSQVDRETRYNAIIRGMKDWTQILANMGLGLVALKQL